MLKQKKHWILKNTEPLSGRNLISYLLRIRGVDESEQERFFLPDFEKDLHNPYEFKDMKRVVERVLQAIAKKEKILIYGDYDADGVTSSTMLNKLLRSLGLEVEVYLPHRENEGYGMNKDVLRRFAAKEYKLVITVDCGISNTEEVAEANRLGMDVIIFDHHIPPETLPKALAIVNPRLKDEKYPFKELSAGGVVFKFIQAFFKDEEAKKIAYSNGLYEGWEKWLMDLAAISTICDSMPLIGENRVIIKYGLLVLSKSRHIGLKKIMEKARLNSQAIDSEKVGFYIGPRINAAGRMEHANLAFELLNTEDDATASRLAVRLNQANTDRQQLVEKIMQQARRQIGAPNGQITCVAYDYDWPTGVVGLVAGKIKDEYYRPTFIIGSNGDRLTGSGRSIDELNIMEMMGKIAASGIIEKFGGHKMACGFSLNKESDMALFKKIADAAMGDLIKDLILQPKTNIDAHLPLENISDSLAGEIAQLAPFGSGNEKPKFFASKVEVVGAEAVGQTKKHLRVFLRDSSDRVWKAMGFGWNNNEQALIQIGQSLDVVYELSENHWNGNTEIQIELIDARLNGK